MPPLDITSTSINLVLMLVILVVAFFVLKGKKKEE